MLHATLVMPVFNEIENLGDVLASVAAQDVAAERLFLVIVDNGSDDGSHELAARWLADSAIRGMVIGNPRRSIPTSLNLGIAHARPGDIVIRLDAHTTYAPDYVHSILAAFETARLGRCRIPPGGGRTAGEQRLPGCLASWSARGGGQIRRALEGERRCRASRAHPPPRLPNAANSGDQRVSR